MSYSNHLIRWTVAGRWIATVGIGIVAALGYAVFRPAHAQDRGIQLSDKPAPAATRNSAAPSSKTDGGGLLTPQDIANKAAIDTSGSELEKKDSPPVKEAETGSVLRDINWLSPHMWAFYVIWFVSIISVAFAVERFLGLRRSKILPYDLAAGLRALASRKGDLDLRHAQRLCKQYPSSMAVVVRAMLAKVGRPLPEIEQAMTEACEHEATRLYTNVRVQNLAFNVAPMLGLAGTVHGIILCFYTTAHMQVGANKMDALATGIYAALICTLAGLIVAITAGILAYYFEGRILKMFQKVEELARLLVPHFERFEGCPRQPALGDKPSHAATIIEMPRDNDDDLDDDDDPLPAPKPKKVEGRP
ncbi:MAG: MotA/TolQ/ExbB proton channel family protein [Thermoguttaceae bacterium]